MNVIIIGAGNVGSTIAGVLSLTHNILMIETDTKRANIARSVFNVSMLNENGVNPRVIEDAISRHSADIIIAATPDDGDNLFVCIVAKNVKDSIRTVARVRDPDFIMRTCDGKYFGADDIISPELTAAKKLANLSLFENAVDYDEIGSLDLVAVVLQVTGMHEKLVGKTAMDLSLPSDCGIAAIYRNDSVIPYRRSTEIRAGDLLFVIGTHSAVADLNDMMGYTRKIKDVIIIGGGIFGSNVAKILEKKKKYIKLIENDQERCRRLAEDMNSVIVINADGIDPDILRSENVGRADVVVFATESDEKNLLGCLVSRDLGALKVVSRYTDRKYEDVFAVIGIKTIVGYHRLIANEITKTLISNARTVMRMDHDNEMLMSVSMRSSRVKGELLGDLQFPEGVCAVCIIREGRTIFPRLDTRIEENDDLLLYAHEAKMHKIEKMLGTKMTGV
ncbi:MAG: Trk system potassium transporter TrkA [Methanomassiliicoccaceae archaeon]|jgi:trk system potassium uptake protein TrkA|nr:Trk system potassium transporter TrkA [Methanomassiliicoccaceae archaeon]